MRGHAVLSGLALAAAMVMPGQARSAPPPTPAAGHFNVGATHAPRTERGLADVRQSPAKGALLGIDVASGNHPGGAPINWAQVAGAGYRFAFIKATEGSYYANPFYAADLAGAEAAGLLVAAYHFANPNDSSGTLQADFAVDHAGVGNDGVTLPLVADLEFDPYNSLDHTNECYGLTPAQMVSWIRAFVKEAHRRTGQLPAIYTVSDWWDKCTGSPKAFAGDPLWIADFASADKTPKLATGWSGYAYWQYTSAGQVPGINVKVRTDISALSPTALEVAAPGNQEAGVNSNPSLPIRSLDSGQPLSYSATGLPAGLAINPATGLITGTAPAAPTTATAKVTVSGTSLMPVTTSFTWSVHNPPDLQAPRARTGMTGGPQLFQVRAPDGPPGCTLTFTATGLPPGLQLSPCGLISGLLSAAGSYHPVIGVSDSSGSLATVPFNWQVHQPADTGPFGPIQLNHSRLCLGQTGSGIGVVQCHKGPSQSWTFTQYGAITLARKCLSLGNDGSKPLRLLSCRNSIFQRWQIRSDGQIANVQSGDCLAVASRKASAESAVVACDGGARQLWRLPAGPLTAAIPGWCASTWEPAGEQVGPVGLRQCRGGRATSWAVEPDGTVRSGGRCLTLTFPAVAGARVAAAACDGRPAERWQVFGGPLAVQILSPQVGLCLAVPGDRVLSPSLALGACTTTDPGATWRLT
jgi:GH25 family lysozyme M1 (1,4-beta-N-acetylmuramidase)